MIAARNVLRVILVLAASLALIPSSANAEFQQMRLAAGSYAISGRSTIIPAHCIRPDQPVPPSGGRFTAGSGSISVERRENGKLVATRPLADVVGKWINVEGNDTISSVTVKVVDPTADYAIKVDPKRGPGILAEQATDLESISAIVRMPAVASAMRKLDEYELQLKNIFGDRSDLVGQFNQAKTYQGVEWAWGEANPAAKIDAFLVTVQGYVDREIVGPVSGLRSPIDHLSLRYGRTFTSEHADALSTLSRTRLGAPEGHLDNHVELTQILGGLDVRTTSSVERGLVLRNLTDDQLRQMLDNKVVIVKYDSDGALAERLNGAGIPFQSHAEFRLQERRDAFEEHSQMVDNATERTILQFRNADPDRPLRVTYLNLKEAGRNGDAILLRCPDDSLVLIDAGLSKASYAEIRQSVAGIGMGQIRMKVVLTHEHADHVGGLLELIRDGDVTIDQIILGVQNPQRQLIRKLVEEMERRGIRNVPVTGADLLKIFVSDSLPEGTSALPVVPRQIEGAPFMAFEIEPAQDVRMQVLQYQHPRDANQSALMVKVQHGGRSQLLTSDIDAVVVRNLMESQSRLESFRFSPDGERFSLKSDILKWPHHVAFPSQPTPRFEKAMEWFLQTVDPHTVLFSNVGSHQTPEMMQRASEFVRNVLGREVRIMWTYEDGHLVPITVIRSGIERFWAINMPCRGSGPGRRALLWSWAA